MYLMDETLVKAYTKDNTIAYANAHETFFLTNLNKFILRRI